jgi:RNA polymerase sigma-B factor
MPTTSASPSEHWLLLRYKRCGDVAARDELVGRMMPLVCRVALSYGARGQAEDLEQVAALGLVKAIDRYDPAYGVPLRTYAIPTMSGEVRRYLRDHDWAVHVPRPLQEQILAITKATERLTTRGGRAPTAGELAEELELSIEEVLEGLQAGRAYTATSLHSTVSTAEDADQTVADLLGAEDDRFHQVEQAASLRSLRDVLDDRDRVVLYLRFVEGLTQKVIGQRVGLSQMHVSRIVRRSLHRLSERLETA